MRVWRENEVRADVADEKTMRAPADEVLPRDKVKWHSRSIAADTCSSQAARYAALY